jgi:hypothetical protein
MFWFLFINEAILRQKQNKQIQGKKFKNGANQKYIPKKGSIFTNNKDTDTIIIQNTTKTSFRIKNNKKLI